MHERALARPAWPHDGGELALSKIDRDVVEGTYLAVVFSVYFGGIERSGCCNESGGGGSHLGLSSGK